MSQKKTIPAAAKPLVDKTKAIKKQVNQGLKGGRYTMNDNGQLEPISADVSAPNQEK